ncbi:uncharacterized protein LOC119333491 [Triticum dicoccoides]|uniref:uncharacterized protein LOC119333491 n=1 Tax=Triticum dicoccoides TaxID=85692 RepID=UPI0018917A64|nr:uncharacterized protein LOC119333491 [Triticum dicoccoides]
MPTLRLATFRQCIFPRINASRALHLPKLKHLELIVVCISKEDLECLLVGCTVLKYLRLHVMDGFSSLHITSTNVHAIYVHCWSRPKLSVEMCHDMVIENAPFLERLYVLDKLGPTRIRVIHAPKLTVLGYLCVQFNELVTGSLFVQEPTQCFRTGTTENKNAAAPHPKLSRSHRWSALPSAPPRPAQRAARPPAPTSRRPCTFPSAPPPRLPQRAAAPPSTSAVDLPSSACFLPALPGSRRCAQRFLPAPPCIGEVRRRVRILQLHPIAAVQRLQLLSLASAARCKVDPNLLQMPVAAMSYDAADGHLPRRAGSDPTAMAASSADELTPVVLEAVVSYGWGSKQRLERSRVYLPGCLLRKRLELHEFAIFCSLGVLLLELVSVQQPA